MSTRGLLGGKKGKERTGSISDEAIEHAYGLQVRVRHLCSNPWGEKHKDLPDDQAKRVRHLIKVRWPAFARSQPTR